MLHHYRYLVLDGLFVLQNELSQDRLCLVALDLGVLLGPLLQLPVGGVGGVVLENIYDEFLLDGLAHRVQAEGHESAVRVLGPEQLQRLGLGSGGEGENADVVLLATRCHLEMDDILVVHLLLDIPSLREHLGHLLVHLTALRGVCLVNQQGESGACELAYRVEYDWELVQRGDDDLLTVLERLPELLGGAVNGLDQPTRLLVEPHGVLQLSVEHLAVGDHDDGVEDALVLRVL